MICSYSQVAILSAMQSFRKPDTMAQEDAWESKRLLTIVAAGRIGSGKSALVNALVGSPVARESGETLDPQTDQLKSYTAKKRGIDITIWDAPGLEIARSPEELERYVQEMEQEIREVDLLLYCTKMDDYRLRQGDTQTIRVLTKAFGASIWRNAVFVLTFANVVQVPRSKSHMIKEVYFEEKLAQWKDELQEAVRALDVPNEIATGIPVVPAGYYNEPTLPNRSNWLSEFWHVCYGTIKEAAQPALLEANLERLRATDEIQRSHFDWPIDQIPMKDRGGMHMRELCLRFPAVGIAGSAALGGIAGFVVGGTLGVVTGLGIGAIGGAVTYAVYHRYYRHK